MSFMASKIFEGNGNIETRLAVDRVKPWLTKMIIIIIIIIVSAQSKELGFWVF